MAPWILAGVGFVASLGASWIIVYAGRRDKMADHVENISEDLEHIKGHLEARTGYRPRRK